jgi:hypothetical protein
MSTVTLDAIRALRVGRAVAERLRAAPHCAGAVHSVFDRVVNLISRDGRLVTLQAPGPLVAPFAVELGRRLDPRRLAPGIPVWRTDDTLELGDTIVRWRDPTIADTAMPETSGPAIACRVLAAETTCITAPALSSTIGLTGQAQLGAGIARRQPDAFLAGARTLLGLGEGLTPAGDDCLVGALAVLHRHAAAWLIMHPEMRAALDTMAATTTTAIAAEFVRHAAAGHFAEVVIDVLTAESDVAARRAMAQLGCTGGTSGADTLCGMRLALNALGYAEEGEPAPASWCGRPAGAEAPRR